MEKERKEFDLRTLVFTSLILFGVLFLVIGGLSYFSFEKTQIRELNLEETVFCVQWGQPFEPEFEDWMNRDQFFTYSFNDPVTGKVFMQDCLVYDFGYRKKVVEVLVDENKT